MSSKAAEGLALLEDEEILHEVRPSWSKWMGSLIIGILTSIVLVGLIILLWVWLARNNMRYVVTNQRLIQISGILGTHTSEYRIADLRQIQTGATWSEKMLGHGNLQFTTGTVEMITFDGVPGYQNVANTIREVQREIES